MAQSSPHQQRFPRIPINGVVLLDKPVTLTSNDALIKVKRLLRAQKAGHTGTLDPFATGLLPLCFGEATKFSQDLLEADKSYEAVVHLGIKTTTGDVDGEIIDTQPVNVSREQLVSVLSAFCGTISQVPPMYSALKRDGKPLYEYARAGVVLEREARQVQIHALTLLDYQEPYVRISVVCSKGTYIRVLGEDIGIALGCGAHLQALRRTGVGVLTLERSITLDALTTLDENGRMATLLPVDSLLSSFPILMLNDALTQRFLHGQRLALGKESVVLPATEGRVRVYQENSGRLLGTGLMQEFGVLAPERLITTATSS